MEEDLDWLAQLYEEQGPSLHRLAVLLGAEHQSGRIVRTALLALHRRGHRLIDPAERVEFLQEQVVHLAHSVRQVEAKLELPQVDDARQEEILSSLSEMPPRSAEILVVSHYLSVFVPELAGIMRLTVRSCTQRLEAAVELLRSAVGDPTPGSVPGAIESLSQELTAALRSAARTVQAPGTETLSNELRELGARRAGRIRLRSLVVVLLLAAVLGLGLAAAAQLSSAVPEVSVQPSQSEVESTGGRSLAAQVQDVTLYYLGRNDNQLYQERHNLSATGDPLHTALRSLFSLAPDDPDYKSAWNAGSITGLELEGDTLVVNLSADAYEQVQDLSQARGAINQVVYTASGVVGNPELKVRFLADGKTPPSAFISSHGFSRQGIDPMPPVWISLPYYGYQGEPGLITIVGSVKPDAEMLKVTIIDEETNLEVHSEIAQTTSATNEEGWEVWNYTVRLESGTYEVRAEASYGTPAKVFSENKEFTIR